MRRLTIPDGYRPSLNLVETERAIKHCKDLFESELAALLKLTRVSAPLFVLPQTGLNDNLNGVERPVSFDIADMEGARVRGRAFPGQMEAAGAASVWVCPGRGTVYGYERNPSGRADG